MNLLFRIIFITILSGLCVNIGAETFGWYVNSIIIKTDTGFLKEQYSYTSSGLPALITISNSDDKQNWTPCAYNELIYENGHIVRSGTFRLTPKSWTKQRNITYSYLGELPTKIETTEYLPDGTTETTSVEKSYDTQTSLLYSESVSFHGEHINNSFSSVYKYDKTNRISEITQKITNEPVPTPYLKATYSYSNRLDSITTYSYNGDKWIPDFRTLFVYMTQSTDYDEVHQLYNNNSWINTAKAEYRTSSDKSETIYYSWNIQFWKPYMKTLREYDDYENIASETTFRMGNNTWRETMSVVYTHSHETSLPEKISAQPLFWYDDSDKAMTSLHCPANLNGSYKTASELEISYIRQIKTTNQDSVNHEISIYPNPSPTGIFYIDSKGEQIVSYTIYNTAGQIVTSDSCPNDATIDLSGQPRGVYIVKILHTGGVQSLKLIRN